MKRTMKFLVLPSLSLQLLIGPVLWLKKITRPFLLDILFMNKIPSIQEPQAI